MARFYDTAQWQQLRALKLRANPLCEGCEAGGVLTPASEVDHVVSVSQAPELRADLSNLRSLCKPCHSAKTAAQDGGMGRAPGEVRRPAPPLRGCWPDGTPRDPAVGW